MGTFVFTKENLPKISNMPLANKGPADTWAGSTALCEVTGVGHENTSSFQDLVTTSEISRDTTEILSEVQLIKTGDRVDASEATLLNMVNISLFFVLLIEQVLTMASYATQKSRSRLPFCFLEGVWHVDSVCLRIGLQLVALMPRSITDG